MKNASMEAKESAYALRNEVMWLIYFCIAMKTNGKFVIDKEEITANYMVSLFSKDGIKLSGLLKKLGINKLSEMSHEVDSLDSTMNEKKASTFFIKDKWHDALMDQTKKYISNSSLKFAKSNNIKVIRQGDFFEKTKITDFLGKAFKCYNLKQAKYDRWNPADVWFYRPNAITAIQGYLDTCVTNDRSSMNKLNKISQKILVLKDFVGLNTLIYKLFESRDLIPLSLKKSTSNKGVYSYRLAKINVPKDENGRPKDPKVIKKDPPIREFAKTFVLASTTSSGQFDYEIEVDQPILNTDGTIKYEKEVYNLLYDNANHLLYSIVKGHNAARAGSAGMNVAEQTLYTANAAREIKQVRRKVLGEVIAPTRIISNGIFVGKLNEERYANSLNYCGELAKLLNPGLKDKKPLPALSEGRINQLNQSDYKSIQNKMEMAFAIHKSPKEDEMILDLWSAVIGKGVTNRKGFQQMIERIGDKRYKQSRKPGQKPLSQAQADNEAIALIQFAKLEGNPQKLPGGFHLKLY